MKNECEVCGTESTAAIRTIQGLTFFCDDCASLITVFWGEVSPKKIHVGCLDDLMRAVEFLLQEPTEEQRMSDLKHVFSEVAALADDYGNKRQIKVRDGAISLAEHQ